MEAEVLASLQPDVVSKFQRYCVPKTDCIRFRFLLRSCPGLEMEDADADALFAKALGQETIDKSSRMTLDAFIAALRLHAARTFPTADGDTALLALLLNSVIPQRLQNAPGPGHPHSHVYARVRALLVGSPGSRLASPQPAPSTTSRSTVPATPIAEAPSGLPSPSARAAPAPSARSARSPANVAFSRAEAVVAELQAAAARKDVPLTKDSAPAAAAAQPVVSLPTVSQFLSSTRLDAFAQALAELGVEAVPDLEELTEAELQSAGFKSLHMRRLKDGLAELRHSLIAKLQPVPAAAPSSAAFTGLDDAASVESRPKPRAASRSTGRDRAVPKHAAEATASQQSHASQQPHGVDGAVDEIRAAALAAATSGAPGKYEWEEYSTPDGFLYYHHPLTGATQWLRPAGSRVRTVAIRTAEQTAIASVVEARIAAALQRQRTSGGRSPIDGSMAKQAAAVAVAAAAAASPARLAAREAMARAAAEERIAKLEAAQQAREDPPPVSERMPWPARAEQRTREWRDAWSELLAPPASQMTGPIVLSAAPNSEARQQSAAADAASSDARQHSAAVAALQAHAMMVAGLGKDAAAAEGDAVRSSGSSTAGSPLKFRDAQAVQLGNRHPEQDAKADQLQHRYGVTLASPRAGASEHRHGLYRAPSNRSMTDALSEAPSMQRRAAHDPAPSSGASANGDISDVITELTASSAAQVYPEVYERMPVMDEKTFETIARGYSVANPRRMGYSDPRTDIRPLTFIKGGANAAYGSVQLAPQLTAAGLDAPHGGTGATGKANSIWASTLRPHLYSPRQDEHAARTGSEIKRAWSSGGVAPSEAVPGYAYRHAAAESIYARAGNVYDRLTDVRGYTGVHRHRFDEEGRGKGLAGRENSYDYNYLINSVETAGKAVAAMPSESALQDHVFK